MPSLHQIKAKELVRIALKLGFNLRSQKGSHAVYIHPDGRKTTIPIHPSQTIGIGLLVKIIKKDLEITTEEFLDLVN